MKLIIYFFFLLPTFLIAQNNLFFNRVLTFKMNSGLEVSVPANKAWHIKSINQSYVNFKTLSPEYGQIVNTTLNISMLEGGVWLGEGDILVSTSNSSAFSILEYDVIPISSGTSGGTTSLGSSSPSGFIGSGQYTTNNDYTTADSFSDIDGNQYESVNIAGVVWSTTNLKVKTFSDGTPIHQATSTSDFKSYRGPAYYELSNGEIVYNWYAIWGDHDVEISTPVKNLAPDGYRVASLQDWDRLIQFYGGKETAAPYLVSKNWRHYQGLNKAGLNLMSPSRVIQTAISGSGHATQWSIGTSSLKAPLGGGGYGELYAIDFGNGGTVIQYNHGFFSTDQSKYYNDGFQVRIVKE